MTAPTSPQKTYRNRLLAAMKEQQSDISLLKQSVADLTEQRDVLVMAVGTLVEAAGANNHPRFASLRALGHKIAGTPDEAPASTTEQARTPDATDSPESKGAVPASANTGVTPAATTDVDSNTVALPEDKPLNNLVDVTAPTAGTDAVDPSAVFNGDVQVGTPSSDSMSETPSGWTGTPGSTGRTSALGGEQERFVAAMRLARLQISLGQAQGEDLALAQAIAATDQPLDQINAVAAALSLVQVTSQPSRQPTAQQRHLVPQPVAGRTGGITPSFQQAPEALPAVQGSRPGEDEWAFGMGGLGES